MAVLYPYVTRIWVIREINANAHRQVHLGREIIEWDHIELWPDT